MTANRPRLVAATVAVVAAALATGVSSPRADGAAVRLIVGERTPASVAVEDLVDRLGGRVVRQLPLVDGLVAEIPARARARLLADPAVTGLWADGVVRMHTGPECSASDPTCFDALPPNTVWEDAIGLSSVRNKYSGSEVTVALLDTGVTPSADLGVRLLARVDLTSERDGIDRFGHGTHLSGLIAGDGTLSQESYEGAASEASLVSIKVAGWDGATDVSTVIAGLQWAVANRERLGIRVLNLSFGTDAIQSATVDPLDYAVEQAWKAGIVVVVAAGNRGGIGTISKPGDDPLVITVGSTDIAGTASLVDDTVAPFSSQGPTQDGLAKPDVLAPGVSLVSIRAPGSTIDEFRPVARVADTYFKGSGTSQSSAIVTGVVVRMIDANRALTPDAVKGVLMQTATPGPAGMVDANAAVAAVVPPKKGPPLQLPLANQGAVRSDGTGSLEGSRGSQHVVSDTDGDGAPEPIAGELDVLGRHWSPQDYAATPWGPETWAVSPWAPRVVESSGSQSGGPGGGGGGGGLLAPLVAWEAKYWGAASWFEAGWDAKYWGAKYWGTKYWGTGLWQ